MRLLRTVNCVALALVCGCSATRPVADFGPATDWEDPEYVAQQMAGRPETSAAGEVSRPTEFPATTWIALGDWCQAQALGELRPVSPEAPAGYEVSNGNGTLIVWPQLKSIRWNGLDVRLGFAPRLINNRLFVHRLDLEKNLHPLLARSQENSRARPGIVVIDPGHGGSNSGTRSRLDGRLEKDFTLDWAMRLQKLLQEQGWRVLLTRTNDIDLSLPDRVAFAEAHQADLFISLHFNASPSRSDQAGVETYCITPEGMPSNLVRDGEDNLSDRFPNNAHDEDNLLYAVRLHRALVKDAGGEDRGVRRARFMGVLRGQNRPAVLVEGGYLSNPDEAGRIANPEHRQKLAAALARALGSPKQEMAAADQAAENRGASLE